MAAFRDGQVRTLIATDIAARGIDVEGISHVINYDLPNVAESYVHRIGRTARAGREGVAISFCDSEERSYLRGIEKLIQMRVPATNAQGEPVTELPHAAPRSKPAAGRHQPNPGRNHAPGKRRRNGGGGGSRSAQPGHERPASPHKGDDMGAVAFMKKPREKGRKDARVPRGTI